MLLFKNVVVALSFTTLAVVADAVVARNYVVYTCPRFTAPRLWACLS